MPPRVRRKRSRHHPCHRKPSWAPVVPSGRRHCSPATLPRACRLPERERELSALHVAQQMWSDWLAKERLSEAAASAEIELNVYPRSTSSRVLARSSLLFRNARRCHPARSSATFRVYMLLRLSSKVSLTLKNLFST